MSGVTHPPERIRGVGAPAPRSDARGARGAHRQRGERGAATLIALALSAFVVMAALVAADLGALAVARAKAQTAADLAALAAVTPAGGQEGAVAGIAGRSGDSATDRAGEIASANGARMTRCTCEPMEAVVGVGRRVLLLPFGVPVEVTAYARAVLPGPGIAAVRTLSSSRPDSLIQSSAPARPSGTGPPIRNGARPSIGDRAPFPSGLGARRPCRLLDAVSSLQAVPNGPAAAGGAPPGRRDRLRHLGARPGFQVWEAVRARAPVQLLAELRVLVLELVDPALQIAPDELVFTALGTAVARRAPGHEEEDCENKAQASSYQQELALGELRGGSGEDLDRPRAGVGEHGVTDDHTHDDGQY